MDANEKILNLHATRVRQLILQYSKLKEEAEQLRTTIAQQENRIAELQEMLTLAQSNYNSLKMAKMIQVSDGDMEGAQKRLSKLIRDVNKCITLLSEK